MPSSPIFDIDIAEKEPRWEKSLPNTDGIVRCAVRAVLERELGSVGHVEVSIVLADDVFVQELNKTYRHKDKPTNVLSFPQTECEDINSASSFLSLGDIVIAYETILSEAQEQGKSVHDHFTHMLVHGCLHLLHYDHQNDDEAEEMEGLEIEILQALGIKNPYQI